MIGDGTHVQLGGNWLGMPRKHTTSDDQLSACSGLGTERESVGDAGAGPQLRDKQ
jgi:hypothetical protein